MSPMIYVLSNISYGTLYVYFDQYFVKLYWLPNFSSECAQAEQMIYEVHIWGFGQQLVMKLIIISNIILPVFPISLDMYLL